MNRAGLKYLLPLLLSIVLIGPGGCSKSSPQQPESSSNSTVPDPRQGYAAWAKAASAGDGAKMYELLDSGQRADMGRVAQDWATRHDLQGLSAHDAFVRMIDSSRQVTEQFSGDYDVLEVDTFYAVTVRHVGKPVDVVMFRWEDGGYRFTAPPNRFTAAAKYPAPAVVPPAGGAADSAAKEQ
jgi:hypothetical protein